MKKRKCANRCGEEAKFMAGLKSFCSYDCTVKFAKRAAEKKREEKEKEDRKKQRERRQKLNDTVPNWIKKAQKEFNKYIRLRDRNMPCVSCGKPANKNEFLTGSGWDAGHYRSTGACPELRFCELNCHKQCVSCNQYKSGNVVEYRIELRRRIGVKNLEWLESSHEPKRYRVEELKEIQSKYKKLIKEMEDA